MLAHTSITDGLDTHLKAQRVSYNNWPKWQIINLDYVRQRVDADNSSSSAFASFKSIMSKPSVNQR